MTKDPLSRRECARRLLLLPALPAGLGAAAPHEAVLRSPALEFAIRLSGGKVASRTLTNRLVDETITLPAEDFALEFAGGITAESAGMNAAIASGTGGRVEVLYSRPDGLAVRVEYRLAEGKPYLRKQISVRKPGAQPLRLMRADLENWRGVKRDWESMHADRLPYASHPVFCENLWAGVEFVSAANEFSSDGFVLRSRPGGTAVSGEWVPLRSTVVGASEPGAVRDAFLAYLEDVRLAPPKWVACYNSWWTLPLRIGRTEHLELARELAARLKLHGVFFDIFATDEGWTDPHTIWEVDRHNLPDGFDDIRGIVEAAGGRLGLWMSPSGTYPRSLDYVWAKQNGYFVVEPESNRGADSRKGVSLACPKYRRKVNQQLKALIRENRFAHIKYDGFIAEEKVAHDGLIPGRDSVEPLAADMLELMQSSKEANPELVTEPTCMNSEANYISPWILKYSDTVWGNSGGDCPLGINPAPDYRESHTNAREYYIFSSLNEFWLPQNAVQYFDIVHCDESGGFPNHAAMAVGRGRFFLSTYLNPKFMTDDDWRIYAGLLKWARANRDILRNTVVAPSRVELGEPYAYGHWLGSRGVLAVRNPSNETKRHNIDLAQTGAPKGLKDAVAYTQFPYRRGIAAGVSRWLSVVMAPWELLFIEVLPRAELREPVAVGARWFREANGGMSVAPDTPRGYVRILGPGEREHPMGATVPVRGQLWGEVISHSLRKVAESSVAYDVECSVRVHQGKGQVFLLLQYMGRERQPRPSTCTVTVNGIPAAVEQRSSAGHTGYYGPDNGVWKGVRAYDSQWTWYICDVAPGTSHVRFTGTAAHAQPHIGLWAWAETELIPTPCGATCPEPAMPEYRSRTERQGITLL